MKHIWDKAKGRLRISFWAKAQRKISQWFYNKIVDWGCSFGFLNKQRMTLDGPRERLDYPIYPHGNSVLLNTNSGCIKIAGNVLLGCGVMILTGSHLFDLKNKDFKPYLRAGNDIEIKEGTWVASGAIICGGVTVGRECLICAGAIVTRDVPDGSIMAGVPAEIIGSTR